MKTTGTVISNNENNNMMNRKISENTNKSSNSSRANGNTLSHRNGNNKPPDKNYLPPIITSTPNYKNTLVEDRTSKKEAENDNLEEITNMMKKIIDENWLFFKI